MKRLLVSILILAMTIAAAAQLAISPPIAGNDASDSVVVTFCTFDTTMYPTLANADSIVALRYGPAHALVDSITQSAANLFRPRTGWYEIRYRAADGSGTLGSYRVYVRAKIGGAWRGAASGGYRVVDDDIGDYFAKLAADSDSLKDTLSLIGQIANAAGRGAYACTLYAFDAGSNTAVPGAFVRALNADESATAAFGTTNSLGRVVFALDEASYRVYSYLSGYSAVMLPQLITVTASGLRDTVWLSRFDPGQPAQAALCRVYGYVKALDGSGIGDVVVTARIAKAPLQLAGVVVSPYSVSTTSDTAGYWYLDLIPNGRLEPDNTKYDFTFHYPSGTILRKQIAAPDSASFWLRW